MRRHNLKISPVFLSVMTFEAEITHKLDGGQFGFDMAKKGGLDD
jgi:hypothetical protein